MLSPSVIGGTFFFLQTGNRNLPFVGSVCLYSLKKQYLWTKQWLTKQNKALKVQYLFILLITAK